MAYAVTAHVDSPSRETISILSNSVLTSPDVKKHWMWCQWGLTIGYGNETDKRYITQSENRRGDTIFSRPPNTTYHFRACIQPDVGGIPSGEIHYSDDATTTTLDDGQLYLKVTGGGVADPDPSSEGYPFSDPPAFPLLNPITDAYQYIDEAVIAEDLFYTSWWRAYENTHYYRQFFEIQETDQVPDAVKFNVLMVRSNRHTLRIGLYKEGLGYWESSDYTSGSLAQNWERWEQYTLETNPLTELPWAEGDLTGLQISIYIKMSYSSGNIGCAYAELESFTLGTALAGCIWVEGTELHYINADSFERHVTGVSLGGSHSLGFWVEGEHLHYIDGTGAERQIDGVKSGATGKDPGHLWVEGNFLRYIDANGDERYAPL